ncbi:hypothetical protein V6R21_27100 [Limibacter armeniacum]|uniref:hypothetical protein n=1 Tax=Limibacter armeniacum TaxID=466084 RepID=UPI002FE52620
MATKRDLKGGLASALGSTENNAGGNSKARVNLPLGYRLTKEHINRLRAIAQHEERDIKEVIDEAIEFYLEFQVGVPDKNQN